MKWTKNTKHAERISKVIEENYGFATLYFAEYLLNAEPATILKKLEFWRNRCLEETQIHNQFSDRISKKYALLPPTTSIAKKASGLEFSVKRILKFILKNEAAADVERDLGLKAYNLFLEWSRRFII